MIEPTLPDGQSGGVDQKEEDVVEEALEDGRVGMIVVRQVLAGQADATDEQGEDLAQCQGEQQLSGERREGEGKKDGDINTHLGMEMDDGVVVILMNRERTWPPVKQEFSWEEKRERERRMEI